MVKYLLSFLIMFLMLSSLSFAKKDDDAKLKSEYGQDLTHAPFFLRFDFYQKYHKDWKNTYYSERKFFLTQYETNLAAEQAKEKAAAKIEAAKEKARLYAKKEELRKERDRLNAKLAQEKAEKKAEAERQKEFDTDINNQQKELHAMEQEIAQERSNPQGNR